MCNSKEKRYIHNINRAAIAGVTLAATLIDGLNVANGLYLASAIAWLFQPECDSAEEQVLDRLKHTCCKNQHHTPAQNDRYNRGAMAYTTKTTINSTLGR